MKAAGFEEYEKQKKERSLSKILIKTVLLRRSRRDGRKQKRKKAIKQHT
jgi:hypothetical protein